MKFFELDNSTPTLHYSHEEFLNRLALESSIQSNVIGFFKEGLPSLLQRLRDYATTLKFSDEHIDLRTIEKDFIDVSRLKIEKKYLQYKDVLVQVPEGFKGEFLPYVVTLNRVGESLYTQTHKLLSEYRFVLSSIITNQEQRTSLKDLSASYEKASTARSELEREFRSFFTDSVVSRARLIDVVPTFRDVKELSQEIKGLNKFTDIKQLKQIQQSIKDIVEILVVLESRVSNDSFSDISPQVVKNVAVGAHELAKYVDQVVVFHYATLSIISCIEQLMKKIKTFD